MEKMSLFESQASEFLKPKKNSKFLVRSDRYDNRDLVYKSTGVPLRESMDLLKWASPIEDQERLGSCVSNAVAGAYELLLNRDAPEKYSDLSRLFIYYNARLIEGSVLEDAGLYLRNGIKSVKDWGICRESLWPYNVELYKNKPTSECYADAHYRNIKNYHRIEGINNVLDALNNNRPVVITIEVYESINYLDKDNYVMTLPRSDEISGGGHAMCAVGYNIPKQMLLVRNSFGKDWGLNGYCWIPFSYMKDNTLDQWVFDIKLVDL
jgi:C1A family cysteine protease